MIDPHAHLRDWKQAGKETVAHGLRVAWKAGLDGVFEMPNTDPPLISRAAVEERIALADAAGSPVFHGLYAGLTADAAQIEEMVRTWEQRFPRVVGLKLYAGSSTGDLSVPREADQRRVFDVLASAGYSGVLAVHCEKESRFRPDLRNPRDPASHCRVRPPEAEIQSIRDILRMAAESRFPGVVHVCHISTPGGVRVVEKWRRSSGPRITCGVTPHHLLLCEADMAAPGGRLLRMNPPLRENAARAEMVRLLLSGCIDWIESDHAPHREPEKRRGAAGIPVLPIYPHILRWLGMRDVRPALRERLLHGNIERTFRLRIPRRRREIDYDLAGEYGFDPFARWKNGP